MRTPAVLVCGQGDADGVAGTLMNSPGTVALHGWSPNRYKRSWPLLATAGVTVARPGSRVRAR
jgi:hypothetical protein